MEASRRLLENVYGCRDGIKIALFTSRNKTVLNTIVLMSIEQGKAFRHKIMSQTALILGCSLFCFGES